MVCGVSPLSSIRGVKFMLVELGNTASTASTAACFTLPAGSSPIIYFCLARRCTVQTKNCMSWLPTPALYITSYGTALDKRRTCRRCPICLLVEPVMPCLAPDVAMVPQLALHSSLEY